MFPYMNIPKKKKHLHFCENLLMDQEVIFVRNNDQHTLFDGCIILHLKT